MRFLPLVLAAIALAGVAAADGADPYKTGVKLENAGSLVDALAAFESIPADSRDYNTKLHIASCKRKLGRLLEAERDYEAIRTDPKADQPTVETAASDLEDLRGRIPKLRVALTPATTGVKVTVDGAVVAVPGTVAVNPGTHSVVATRGTKDVYRRDLSVAEGTTVDVEVDAPATVTAAPSPTTSESNAVAPPSTKGDAEVSTTPFTRTLGIIVGGVGVAAIGGGIFFAVRAQNLESDAKAAAGRGDTNSHEFIDDARGAQLFARIGLGAGAVALIGGGILLLSSRGGGDTKSASSATLKLAPAIGAAWGLSLGGEF